jgi:hypothetical protein
VTADTDPKHSAFRFSSASRRSSLRLILRSAPYIDVSAILRGTESQVSRRRGLARTDLARIL